MKMGIAGWLLVVSSVVAAPLAQAETDSSVKEGVKALLLKHDKALKEHDIKGVLDSYVSGSDAVLMGTGSGELWVGQEQIKEAYEHIFADFDPGALETHCSWRSAGGNDQMAWLVAMCRVTDYLKNIKREYAVNISTAVEKQGSEWRFRTFHISNLTGGE